MNEALAILTEAITDVGCWNWWTEHFPDCFQVEFSGVQLWNEPRNPAEPPSGIIALRFSGLKSVCFLTRNADETPEDWADRLRNDEFEQPPSVSFGEFTFEPDRLGEILEAAERFDVIFGLNPAQVDVQQSPALLAFWAGEMGVCVMADRMDILNVHGPVPLNEIATQHAAWWEYWKKYWEVYDTPQALPLDYACEVTIPAETLEEAKGEL